ncbi:MAG: PAS domain S-box protein [Anaerolineales bacterium]|nr:PAS domain S-box protein [Anaerolineales bacterium]
MIFIDTRTVLISYIISNVICASMMITLWWQNRRRSPDLIFWMVDFIMQFTGVVLLTLRGILPDFFSMILSNILIVGGTFLLLIGLERYLRKTGRQWHNHLYMAAFTFIHIFFVYIQPNILVRTANNSFGIFVFCSQGAWLLLRRVEPSVRRDTWGAGAVFAAFSLISLLRIFVNLIVPPENDLFKSGLFDTLVILIYQMLTVSLTFSLFLMVNQRLNKEIQQDKENLELIFNTSPDAMLVTRIADGHFVDINDGFIAMTGYSRADVLGKSALEIHLWKDAAERQRMVAALNEKGYCENMEAVFQRKDKSELIGNISAKLISLQGISHIISVTRDITEHKLAEETLRRSETHFREAIEFAPTPFNIADHDGNMLVVNRKFTEKFGYTIDDIPSVEVWLERAYPNLEYRAAVLDQWERDVAQAFQNGTTTTLRAYKITGKYGTQHDVEMVARFIGNMSVASFNDITERKRAEERLRESEERYHSLFNIMDEGLAINEAVLDENGDVVDYIILSVNPAFERHTIYKTEQVLGKPATEVYQMSPEYIRDWWRNHSQIVASAHTEMYHEPSKRWFHVTTTPPEGKRFATIFIDITERRQAEENVHQLNLELEKRVEERTHELRIAQEQLVRHEKLAVLGQMSSSVGHELRNPLSVIASAIYYLKLIQPNADDKVKQYLGVVDQEVRNSDKIITDLLDFARVKSVDREAVSASELIRQTLERFPVPESVNVSIEIPDDLPRVYVDVHQITQVLGNLTVNACQAMSGSTPDMLNDRQLSLYSRIQNDMINITVQDNGVGISPENMKKIFEPLFTTKTKGIGLGLAVSQKLVDANGGRIEVESEAGKGTSFHVYLPIYEVVPVIARDEE